MTRILRLRDAGEITRADATWLQKQLLHESTRARRLALYTIEKHKVLVPAPILEALLTDSWGAETIDLPLETAGPRASADDVRREYRVQTVRAVLNVMWHQAIEAGVHPEPARVEPFLAHASPSIRVYAARVLSANDQYVPGGDVKSAILDDTSEVQQAASKFMER